MILNFGKVDGVTEEEAKDLIELADVFNFHHIKNEEKNKYYEGHISLSQVNLGLALPKKFHGLEIGCAWGQKTVDVLASRSMFDGFVSGSGEDVIELAGIIERNKLISEYKKACKDELKYGTTFTTLSSDENGHCKIRFHSPMTASALWDGVKGRIKCGIAIIDTVQNEKDKGNWHPSVINYYTDTDIIVLNRYGDYWMAERYPHQMGQPLMVPFIWNATSDKPFGRSRIKEPVRRLIEGYVRTIANATIGLEFSTAPQKYLMGVTDEQYDALINDSFKTYIGSILTATTNPDTGTAPQYGQLPQGNISPHVEMLRILATQFSAATGLTVTDTGVVNNANPTSSDAILAQSQTLVSMAEELNSGNGESLKMIAKMAIAIERNISLNELEEDMEEVMAHFKNPAMPSVAVTADAAVKIASSRKDFANTDIYLEMVGFDQADIRRIKAQEQRARGNAILMEEFNEDQQENVE